MLRRSTLLLVLLTATGSVLAADDMPAPEASPHQTIMFGKTRISPDTANVTSGTAIDFQNMSLEPMTVRFIAPDNMKSMVKGEHVGSAGKAPWLVFYWDYENRLVATLDPGRVGSLCCLAPGNYSYTVAATFRDSAFAGSGVLPMKGTITVK